jgi:hypothetical protein
MHKISYAFRALALLLLGSLAHAQTAGNITFSANRTWDTGSLTPVLTWSTSPVATSCVASGAWSGNKFASGSETVATITASKSYTLTCTWGNGAASISWIKPTTNSDGSALTDLTGYKILFGTSSSALNQSMMVNNSSATSATVSALASGTWFFAVRSLNSKQVESVNSSVAQKTITGTSAAKAVAINITATTLKTTGTSVYDVLYDSAHVRYVNQVVGTVALGKPCKSYYKVGTSYYMLDSADVKLTVKPRSTALVARCATS